MDVSDPETVDERHARLHLADDADAVGRELDDCSVLRKNDRPGGDPRFAGKLRMCCQHAEFAVDRHHGPRPQQ